MDARLLFRDGTYEELAVRMDERGFAPQEIAHALPPDFSRVMRADPQAPVAPSIKFRRCRNVGQDTHGWLNYAEEGMTTDDIDRMLREIYAPAVRQALAPSPVWDDHMTHVQAHLDAMRRRNRAAFAQAVEAEMRSVAQGLAREAGGHLDDDGFFWPDAQVVRGDDEPFPF